MRLAAGIFLDQVESFDRRVELRAVGISQQHELAPATAVVPGRLADHPRVNFGRGFRAGSVQLNQPLELAYAMVDVYDVIADFQVAEIGEEGGGARPLRFRRPFGAVNRLIEDVAFGVKVEGRLRQGEAGGEVADDDARRAQRVILVERLADAVGDATAGQNDDSLIAGCRLPFEFGGEIAETSMPTAHGARRYLDFSCLRLRRKKKQWGRRFAVDESVKVRSSAFRRRTRSPAFRRRRRGLKVLSPAFRRQ